MNNKKNRSSVNRATAVLAAATVTVGLLAGGAGAASASTQTAETSRYQESWDRIPEGATFPYADPATNGWMSWDLERNIMLPGDKDFWEYNAGKIRIITNDRDFEARPVYCAHERWAVFSCVRNGKEMTYLSDEPVWKGTYTDIPMSKPELDALRAYLKTGNNLKALQAGVASAMGLNPLSSDRPLGLAEDSDPNISPLQRLQQGSSFLEAHGSTYLSSRPA